MVQRRIDRVRGIRSEEVAGSLDKEEDSDNAEVTLNNLSIETEEKEEEATERLVAVLGMEVDGYGEGEGKG